MLLHLREGKTHKKKCQLFQEKKLDSVLIMHATYRHHTSRSYWLNVLTHWWTRYYSVQQHRHQPDTVTLILRTVYAISQPTHIKSNATREKLPMIICINEETSSIAVCSAIIRDYQALSSAVSLMFQPCCFAEVAIEELFTSVLSWLSWLILIFPVSCFWVNQWHLFCMHAWCFVLFVLWTVSTVVDNETMFHC